MKNELATTDAGLSVQPQPEAAIRRASERRPAPIAAGLEINLWIVSSFDVIVCREQKLRADPSAAVPGNAGIQEFNHFTSNV